MAPTVTHIGLLTLLAGVTITSWTGFSGFQPIPLGSELDFKTSQHSKLWIGKLPQWRLKVEATRRENYEGGEAKQWYSTLSVLDPSGKTLKSAEISVNNPLTYDGVDVYQSSWGLDHILVTFNDRATKLFLRPMGNTYAAFLPLDQTTILIFSVRGADQPVRIFAKTAQWTAPRILTELHANKPIDLGSVKICLKKIVPITGLQYKCDPGLVITYTAFGFIICGVILAAVPHRQVWAHVEGSGETSKLTIGGMSRKGKIAFARSLERVFKKVSSAYAVAGDCFDKDGNLSLKPTVEGEPVLANGGGQPHKYS